MPQFQFPARDHIIVRALAGLSPDQRARAHKLIEDQLRGVRDRRDSDVRHAVAVALVKVCPRTPDFPARKEA